jgi:hypothetical protein
MATTETEQNLLELARYVTAAQLKVVVRSYRGVLNYELGEDRPERRYVRLERDNDGSLLIQARLPAEEGAVVAAALEAGRDALRESRSSRSLRAGGAESQGQAEADDPGQADSGGASAMGDGDAGSVSAETTHTGDNSRENGGDRDGPPSPATPPPTVLVSNADALLLMADTFLSSCPAARAGGDGYQVVVHVDAAALVDDEDGSCQLEEGTPLHPETARRLACDASVVRILERDRRPLSGGRKSRSVPPALRRPTESRPRLPLPWLHPAAIPARPPHRPLGEGRANRPVEPHPALLAPSPAPPRGRLLDRTGRRRDAPLSPPRRPGYFHRSAASDRRPKRTASPERPAGIDAHRGDLCSRRRRPPGPRLGGQPALRRRPAPPGRRKGVPAHARA